MTSPVVADSGILLATALEDEPLKLNAQTLLTFWRVGDHDLAAPILFRYEIVAVIRKHVSRGRLSVQEGIETRDRLLSLPVSLYLDDDLLRRGYELATRFNRPTAYDTQYLAVAERLNCEFWTADERLYNAVHNDLNWVKWLGNFSSQQ